MRARRPRPLLRPDGCGRCGTGRVGGPIGSRETRIAITVLLFACGLIAVAGTILTPDTEFSPVFSGSFMCTVSYLRGTVEREIVAMEGGCLPNPRPMMR